MTTTTPQTSPAPQAPTDAPIGAADTGHTSDGRGKPRGARKRVIGNGEGDYMIFEMVAQHPHIPKGSLVPVPGIRQQFESTQQALSWIRNESGDKLAGKQVMVLRALEIMTLRLQQRPTVVIETKPKMAPKKSAETSDG